MRGKLGEVSIFGSNLVDIHHRAHGDHRDLPLFFSVNSVPSVVKDFFIFYDGHSQIWRGRLCLASAKAKHEFFEIFVTFALRIST